MRSRYAAFALRDAAYLARTLHDEHPDRSQPEAALRRSLHADRRRYPSLAILDHRSRGRTAEVLFRAGVLEAGRDVSFVELSDFALADLEHGRCGWRYLSGVLLPVSELGPLQAPLQIDAFLALAAR